MVTRSRLDHTEYDPICGAPIDPAAARLVTVRDGVAYYFCSADCETSSRAPSPASLAGRSSRRAAVPADPARRCPGHPSCKADHITTERCTQMTDQATFTERPRTAGRPRPDRLATDAPGRYIPALGYPQLTGLYDAFHHWLTPEREIKTTLVQQAAIRPGERVLDVGSGTGTLTVMLQQSAPEARVVGVDGDPQVLALARSKARALAVDVPFDEGLAHDLPYRAGAFDCVASSLVWHHLDRERKGQALREVWRVLRPGGRLLLLDLCAPTRWLGRLIALGTRHMEEAADNIAGL